MSNKVPDWLDDLGKQAWKRLAKEIVITSANSDLIASLCEEWSLYRQCVASIRKDGRQVPTERNGTKPNPDIKTKNDALANYLRICKQLNIGADILDDDDDPLAEFKE